MVKITVTMHDTGRAFRTSRERRISMKQALDIHDPFINPAYKGLVGLVPWVDSRLGAAKPPRPLHYR